MVTGPPCATFGTIALQIPDVDLACGERFCLAPLVLRVHNGGSTPVKVERARIRDPSGPGETRIEWDDGGWLGPDADLVHRTLPTAEGVSEVDLVIRDGPLLVRLTCSVHIKNSVMHAARAACKACNGTFGPQGMLGNPGCSCRTHDAGKPCWGASECEAGCLATPARRGSPGQCAPTTTRFGCHTWVNDGGGTARMCID